MRTISEAGQRKNRAISRTAVLVVIVLLIIIAAVTGVVLSQPRTSPTTGSSATSVSSSSSFTTSSSSSTPTSSGIRDTVVIDSWAWPFPGDLSQLQGNLYPWPNWQMYNVYQTLVTVNETALWQQGNIQFLPGLASNWTVSTDGKTYTLSLRHNVTFSNGDPFNSYQVWMEFYALYFLAANDSSWLNNYNVFNYSGVNFGPATMTLIGQSGLINPSQQALNVMMNSSWPIYVTGPYQIVLRLKSPFVWLPGTLLSYGGLLYDSQYVLNHGGFGNTSSPNTSFNQNPIPGTGPYMVTAVAENSYAKFTQNPTYWGRNLAAADVAAQPLLGPGRVKNVIVYYKPDDLSRYTDLSTGASQISDIEASDWNLVVNNHQYSYLTLPPWNGLVSALGLNTQTYPTNITLVRQAIVHAINYTDLYDKAYQGNMTPFVGPEYPAWKEFYDLGNFSPYQYNLTLAKADLAEANIANMPTFLLRTEAACQACIDSAQVVQSDLAQLGVTVNIEVLTGSQYLSVYGSYSFNSQNAQQIGQLSWVDAGEGWGAFALTPADYWLAFVNNQSLWGNWAIYSNPTVQACVNSFTSTTDIGTIKSMCTAAQAQIYNDAPYAWIGVFGLWLPPGGSTVWNKNVIKSFLIDPTWGGQSSVPFFNTITFAGS